GVHRGRLPDHGKGARARQPRAAPDRGSRAADAEASAARRAVSDTHMERALGSQRAMFDIPDGVTYLNCASMSPQLRTVTEAGIDAVRAKASPWTLRPSDWFDHAEPLRALFGRVIGADAESVALVPSVSYG